MLELSFTHISLSTFFMVYLAGVLTSLTPCVYPILPIVVGYLGGQEGTSRQRFFSSSFYVLGLSLVYSSLGLLAALTGDVFGSLTQNMYVYLFFGVIIIILAGNMMDFYQIPLPQFLQPKPSQRSQKISYFKSFLTGATSGLVASPCTAPILASLFVFIASNKQYTLGSILMFVFSLGLNTLLLAVGFLSGGLKKLPKSGQWMLYIKKALSLILMAGGLYFIFKAGQLS